MPEIKMLYRTLLHDKDGKLVDKTPWKESKSFVIAFLQLMYSAMAQAVSTDAQDTGNITRTLFRPQSYTGIFLGLDAPVDDDTQGIVVGTGDTPVTNTDYALETQVAQGVGATQLDHGASSFTLPAEVVTNVDFVLSRTYYNGSGATITVKEIGIYTQSAYSGVPAYSYFCIVRDVLPAPRDVPNTQTLTVQYTLRTTA